MAIGNKQGAIGKSKIQNKKNHDKKLFQNHIAEAMEIQSFFIY
jgi:hypothetical protein